MEDSNRYRNIISDLIKKQMVMLGPNVALGQARKINTMSVADDGTVTDIVGDPQTVLQSIAKQYMALSGAIAQMTLESILAKYPEVKLPSN